jgi:hypothetical protein
VAQLEQVAEDDQAVDAVQRRAQGLQAGRAAQDVDAAASPEVEV